MKLLLILTGISILIFFIWFAIVSIKEKEPLATKRSLLIGFTLPIPYLLFGLEILPDIYWLDIIMLADIFLTLFILIIPIKGKHISGNENPNNRFDERNTMFSRKEITNKSKLQDDYYKLNPDKLKLDKQWQNQPGLMSEKSSMYSSLTFAAANASFFPIEQLRPFVNGTKNAIKREFTPEKLTKFIVNWSKKLGAVSVGFCNMQDYHYYLARGRGDVYGSKVEPKYNFGIALTIEMDKDFLATGPAGPTLMESARQYMNSGVIAVQIAKFIRELGYEARAHIDGNYEVIAPLVARDAGLGELGRMGLLMTPQLGPRVRLAVITTNIPVITNKRKPDYTVQDFCSICKKCADVCPSQAIQKGPISEMEGVLRWKINHEKCYGYWCATGTDCGRCMSVCPYSHPNNLLHNMVRWGIGNNWLFRRVALLMDDFFYGRKPKPTKVPDWMRVD